jgi:hypothetical protein
MNIPRLTRALPWLLLLASLGLALDMTPSWTSLVTTFGLLGMASASYGLSLSGAGLSIQKSLTRTGDGQASVEVTLPAGKTVTAWVKTDANTAACDLPSGHGYANGNFDVFWSSGGVNYIRRNVPGTISTNALSLDGGAGTDFPASATSGVVVCRQVAFNIAIDGDNCKIVGVCAEIAAQVSTRQHVSLYDSADDEITNLDLTANEPSICDITGGATNLYTGDPITDGVASNGDTTYEATLKIIVISDATP